MVPNCAGERAVADARIRTRQTSYSGSLFRDRLAHLTEGQIDCLRLVHRHLSSKEIAAELGISRHTVDQRIRRSLRILDLSHRRDAARIAEQYFDCPTADHLIRFEPPDLLQQSQLAPPQIPIPRLGSEPFFLGLPFATKDHSQNEMSIAQRLLWIALIAIGASLSAGMSLAGLESLSRLLTR